jgi:hypothetical protein
MHSFSFRAIGYLASPPDIVCVTPDKCFTRLCLISNDFVVEDPECRSCITSTWFVAVDIVGHEISFEARKGDQLIVEGVVLREHWTRQNKKVDANQRVKQEFIFLVTGYRFGVKRQLPGVAATEVSGSPAPPATGAIAQ